VITNDEPVLGADASKPETGEGVSPVKRIRDLVTTQPYGVLATHGDDQAYGSLVAFAFTDDLRQVVFATLQATRKYRLLSEHAGVALVVDNRPAHPDEMMDVEAVTVTGRAEEVAPGPEREALARQLLARHPQLRSFVQAKSCALFRIQVVRFLHVSRFQEVRQWVPQGD
jgi:nitroimidazol reductase NimA-like FMN-containing flavoprotein (pyridoxamine 5'-phosphate oxidase superfamily)